ncbi:major facilitator superfamily domain-containing protein [Aspergillus floccosus]
MVKSINIVSDEQPPTCVAFTQAEERRLIRKIDLHLMPLLTISYAFQLLDKTSLSYAAMLGIKTDLHLVGQQYSWTSSIFYIGYLVSSYPISVGFVKFPLAKFLSLLIGAWGIVLTLHAVSYDYPSLMVLRVFLGVCESSQTHGFSLITGMWYTPREQVTRHMVWAMGNCLGEVVGSLISYGLLYFTRSFPQWKILFILFGLLTVFWSIVLWFFLPDSPDSAYFLNEKERAFAAPRPKKFQHTTQTKIWKRDQFLETLRDPKSWWFTVFMFNLMVPSGGVTAFSTILVNSFGFNKYTTVLMGLPAVGVQLLSFLIISFITTTVRRARLKCIAGLHVNSLLGILLVKLLPEEKKWGRLVGFWLVRAYTPMLPLTLTLLASNTAGFTKKSTTGAMLFIGYCVGNLVGPQFFLSSEAPIYQTAYTTWMICFVLTIFLSLGMRVYLRWENRRRDREQEMHVDAEDKLTVDFQTDGQLDNVDETDRMNRGFRYVL